MKFGLTTALGFFTPEQQARGRSMGLARCTAEALGGVLDGVSVVATQHAQGQKRSVVAALEPSLMSGLWLATSDRAPSGTWAFLTGDAAFDGIFTATCDPSAVDDARVLLDAHTRALLLRAAALYDIARVTDHEVSILRPNVSSEPDEIETDLRLARDLAAAVAEGRGRSEGAPALVGSGHIRFLRSLADARGLAFSVFPLTVGGLLERDSFALSVTRFGVERFRAVITLRFDARLGYGLSLHQAGALDRLRDGLGFRDVQLGDAAFDRAWEIRAADPAAAQSALDSDAQRALTALAEAFPVVAVSDEQIALSGPLPSEPAALGRAIDQLERLAARLRVPYRTHAPYR